GSFIQTLVLTDIATGWTECAPLIVRERTLLSAVLTELRKQLPFALLGFDTDNDTVFINETLKPCCEAANIVFTGCRPYRKNDQAFVEQKNGAVVVGYRRFEGLEAAKLLAELYRSARLFVNITATIQASFANAAEFFNSLLSCLLSRDSIKRRPLPAERPNAGLRRCPR
ncbi:hypothetical protein SAMN05216525_1883, partial [Bradyrhizobium sp. Gha]